MNTNRKPITIRVNLNEQRDIADLITFFTKPGVRPTEKDIFKIALSMLIDSSKQLQRKQQIDAAAKAAQEQQCDTSDTPYTPSSSQSSPSPESPAA